MIRGVALLIAFVMVASPQPIPALRIVVIAGEDAVNVVQQKTATAPVVEVRDRNNLPVSGAVVTFAVQGGRSAAFAKGASVLTITTNAAGQATAAGLTPLASGAVHISVEAAFQGQMATAAIAQVNVMTATEAAAAASSAAGASSGGGSGGAPAAGGAASGGGLSGTTIGIIGGAAAAGVAGAVVAKQSGGSESRYSGGFAIDWVFAAGSCMRDERFAGTLVITLDDAGDSSGSVSGEASVDDGVADILAVRGCSPGPFSQPGRLSTWGMPGAQVTGTRSSLTFSVQDAPPALDGSGPINRSFRFTGNSDGNTITGTYAMTWRNTAGNATSGESRVTLSKQ